MTKTNLVFRRDDSKNIRHEDYIAGVGKAMAILECFSETRHRLTISMAAEKADITRAAARRHLLTLVYLGYLESDGKYFYLSPKILKFSGAYLSSTLLPKVSQSFVNTLNVQTGYIYSVMVLDGYEAITIARSQTLQSSERVNPDGLSFGSRLPAHAVSAGKILLANLDNFEQLHWLEQYGLKRITAYTHTEVAEFLALLALIKQQGWCYSKEEHELGVHALAVPVLKPDGRVTAALNIVVLTHKATKESLLQEILPILQKASHQITAALAG